MRPLVLLLAFCAVLVRSQGPGGGGPGGRGDEPPAYSCPEAPGTGFQGVDDFISDGGLAAPLLGLIACVDNPTSTVNDRGETIELAQDIYGPFEAGFSVEQVSRLPGCGDDVEAVRGGIDTEAALGVMKAECGVTDLDLLNNCGGHASFHYHEDMSCLYTADPDTQHSTRIATALDGHGIYGKYIDGGVLPTDLDACGGRTGVTPDSDGNEVYYYPMKDRAPFTLACFGPVSSMQECKNLYPEECGDDATEIETADGGIMLYDLWCPCFDSEGVNTDATEAFSNGGDAPADAPDCAVISALSVSAFLALIFTTAVAILA